MRTGVPSSSTKRSRGAAGQPSASPPSGFSGLDRIRAVRRLRRRRHHPRERRLVPEAARPVDGAEQAHQDRERADGLEAVRMRGEPAHRVERHRIAGDGLVLAAPRVGPRDRQLDLRVARGDAQLLREAVDRRRRDCR